tara:strand:- start:981 stop:1784 length:804 start_codon:yes stop_codon:yes gene_type:complete
MLEAVDAVPRSKAAVLGPLGRTVRAASTPVPLLEVLATAPTPLDLLLSSLLATGLWLGPDFLLAPAGLALELRLGYRTEALVGRILSSGEWLDDRAEGLAAPAPAVVRATTVALCASAGFVLERLLSSSGSEQAALYLGASTCIWGGLYEVARPKLKTRDERELEATRQSEFLEFAEAKLRSSDRPADTVHETEVVRAFRRYYPKYRAERGVSDKELFDLMRRWMSVPRRQLLPGGAIGAPRMMTTRSAAGYYSSITLTQDPDVGLG